MTRAMFLVYVCLVGLPHFVSYIYFFLFIVVKVVCPLRHVCIVLNQLVGKGKKSWCASPTKKSTNRENWTEKRGQQHEGIGGREQQMKSW